MEIYKVFRRKMRDGIGLGNKRDYELGYYNSVEKVMTEYPDARDEDYCIAKQWNNCGNWDGIFYKKIEVK